MEWLAILQYARGFINKGLNKKTQFNRHLHSFQDKERNFVGTVGCVTDLEEISNSTLSQRAWK